MDDWSWIMRNNKLIVKRGSKALEMSMRDVLDSLEETANIAQYESEHSIVQILSIEEVRTEHTSTNTADESRKITNIYSVTNPPIHRSKDVVSFLFEREEKANSLLSAWFQRIIVFSHPHRPH